MKNNSIRNTAARLNRFKKPEHWSQWRVEEAFAVHAEAVVANNKAIFDGATQETGVFWEEEKTGEDIIEDLKNFCDFIRNDSGISPEHVICGPRHYAYYVLGYKLDLISEKLQAAIDYQLPKVSFKDHLKAAFPFFWSAEVQKVKDSKKVFYRWKTTQDNRVRPGHGPFNCRCVAVPMVNNTGETIHAGQHLYLDPDRPGCLRVIPFEMSPETRKQIVESSKLVFPDKPKPTNLTPYYVVAAVWAALLIIDGLIRHLKSTGVL